MQHFISTNTFLSPYPSTFTPSDEVAEARCERVSIFLFAFLIRVALLRTVCAKWITTQRPALTHVSWVCGAKSVAHRGGDSSWVCSALSPNTESLCLHSASSAPSEHFTLARLSRAPVRAECACLSCKGLEACARVVCRSRLRGSSHSHASLAHCHPEAWRPPGATHRGCLALIQQDVSPTAEKLRETCIY